MIRMFLMFISALGFIFLFVGISTKNKALIVFSSVIIILFLSVYIFLVSG